MTEYHQAAPTDWLEPGQTATVDVAGRPVTIGNVEGDYFAFSHECPHQGTPLGGVPLQRRGLIRCPEHGTMFDITTGQCVLASNDGWKGPIATYPARVVDGVVEVSLEP